MAGYLSIFTEQLCLLYACYFIICFFWPLCTACGILVLCECSVVQSCLTLCNPINYSPPRILSPWDFCGRKTRVGCCFILQGIFWPRDWTQVSCVACIAGRFFTTEPPGKPLVAWPGIKPVPPTVEAQSPNHCIAWEVPKCVLLC